MVAVLLGAFNSKCCCFTKSLYLETAENRNPIPITIVKTLSLMPCFSEVSKASAIATRPHVPKKAVKLRLFGLVLSLDFFKNFTLISPSTYPTTLSIRGLSLQ